MTLSFPVITLDGPSGTGKGTLCHKLAKHLNWHVLDSGAIYRALALSASLEGVDDTPSLVELALGMRLRFTSDENGHASIYLDEDEVSALIRSEQVGQDASRIAAIGEVREALLMRQRAFLQPPGLVADGRDMGTVVFPQAPLKFYITASAHERAKRRYLQLKAQAKEVSLAEVLDELTIRDERDTARTVSPLIPAADAVSIDTTGLSIVQVFEIIVRSTRERGLCA